MDAMLDAVKDIVAAEPEAGEQPATVQPDDGAAETRLTQEITDLWSSHLRLSGDRKMTSKELRLVRAKLAQRLHEMKSLLSCPGRAGLWRSWLRDRKIPRSTADRLATRYVETLGSAGGTNVLSEAIPESPDDNAEKLANTVWQRFRKVLRSDDHVVRFINRIAEISGVRHEQQAEGLMIFHAAPKANDVVTSVGVSAAASCTAPLPPEGDANPMEAPAADKAPQPSDELLATADEPPASVPATDSSPEPSSGTPTSADELTVETTATPMVAEQVPAVADACSGAVV